jgi:hypothetical protein
MLRTDSAQRIAPAAVAGGGVVIAIALVSLFRPAPESTFEEAADAAPPVPSVADFSPANPVPTAAAPTASSESNVERAPLPGEALTTPMAQAIADLRSNMIITSRGPEVPDPTRAQVAAEGERQFGAEAIDSEWAPGAEAALLAKIAQTPGLELIDLQVQCRSTMCRLELTQPRRIPGETAGPPFPKLLYSLGMEPRWMMTIPGGDGGPTRSFAYLWRDGFAPPREQGGVHETN